VSKKNIGRICTLGFCEAGYEIEDYNPQLNQYLVKALSANDDCTFFGWEDASKVKIRSEQSSVGFLLNK